MLFVYEPTERFMERRAASSSGRVARWWRGAVKWPQALHDGEVAAIALVKHRDPALLGAIATWGFDIAVLWAGFRAFRPLASRSGDRHFVLRGDHGEPAAAARWRRGVEGGMIGCFLGFGVPRHLAVLAVLAYRTVSYWLPTIPGAIAYLRLRRRLKSSPTAADGQREVAR